MRVCTLLIILCLHQVGLAKVGNTGAISVWIIYPWLSWTHIHAVRACTTIHAKTIIVFLPHPSITPSLPQLLRLQSSFSLYYFIMLPCRTLLGWHGRPKHHTSSLPSTCLLLPQFSFSCIILSCWTLTCLVSMAGPSITPSLFSLCLLLQFSYFLNFNTLSCWTLTCLVGMAGPYAMSDSLHSLECLQAYFRCILLAK